MVLTTLLGLLVWRQLGDLVSASTALGLHRQLDDGQPVTFISQTKKRLFTVIFNIDKSSSLLCGRPPALSYRYTKFKLPLDVSQEAVMRGGIELQRAIQALDANGWNTEGKLYTATTTRVSIFSERPSPDSGYTLSCEVLLLKKTHETCPAPVYFQVRQC
jgi:hypothetical protein